MTREEEIERLAQVFVNLGTQSEQGVVMAKQMLKRADQLSEERSIPRTEALDHLMKVLIAGRKGESYLSLIHI